MSMDIRDIFADLEAGAGPVYIVGGCGGGLSWGCPSGCPPRRRFEWDLHVKGVSGQILLEIQDGAIIGLIREECIREHQQCQLIK